MARAISFFLTFSNFCVIIKWGSIYIKCANFYQIFQQLGVAMLVNVHLLRLTKKAGISPSHLLLFLRSCGQLIGHHLYAPVLDFDTRNTSSLDEKIHQDTYLCGCNRLVTEGCNATFCQLYHQPNCGLGLVSDERRNLRGVFLVLLAHLILSFGESVFHLIQLLTCIVLQFIIHISVKNSGIKHSCVHHFLSFPFLSHLYVLIIADFSLFLKFFWLNFGEIFG